MVSIRWRFPPTHATFYYCLVKELDETSLVGIHMYIITWSQSRKLRKEIKEITGKKRERERERAITVS